MRKLKLISLLLLSVSVNAFAFPEAPVNDLNFRPSLIFKNLQTDTYDFEGIVKLNNCSGSLIKLEGQSNDAMAIVMTNGHCVPRGLFGGFLKPGEVWSNKAVNRRMKIFKDAETLFNITATKIIYATMTDTDMALYELDETYNEIMKRTGVTALSLSSQRPVAGTNIEIISGYWERGYSCAIDGFVYSLLEADWTFTDSIRYTKGCDTIGGTSGSPIIATATREVIAINNTSNVSGERCTMNNPCEVDSAGNYFVQKGLRYGQQTYDVYSCLTAQKELSLEVPGCNLPK